MVLQKLYRIARNNKTLARFITYHVHQASVQQYKNLLSTKRIHIAIPFTFAGLWGFIKKEDDKKAAITTREVLIAKADAMFEQGQYKEIHDILSNYKESKDVEILWRLSRALYKMSLTKSHKTEAYNMIEEAYEICKTALNLQEDHAAVHKWLAILLDSKTYYIGIAERIRLSYKIKEHMLRAAELNPKDPTIFYLLGNWCFQVASLTWYQKQLSATFFTDPPVSSYKEALEYFKKAEEVGPNFYSHNLLMLGKTCLKLRQKEEAIKYLQLTCDYPAKDDSDHKAKQEAQKLLNDIL